MHDQLKFELEQYELEREQFKREMDSLNYYWRKIMYLNLDLLVVAVKLYEAGAITYSPKTQSLDLFKNNKLNLMLEEERLITRRKFFIKKFEYCDLVLSHCSDIVRDALILKYVNENSWEQVSHKLSINRSALTRKIDSELFEILKGAIAP